MRFRVLKPFAKDGEKFSSGDFVRATPNEAALLRANGLISEPIRTATRPPETRAAIRHKGGPWYELPNGERVRGKDEAERRLRENGDES